MKVSTNLSIYLMKGVMAMNKIPKIEEVFTEKDKEFNRKMVELGQNSRKNETHGGKEDKDPIGEILDDFSKKWGI